jgi:hypothetical protein
MNSNSPPACARTHLSVDDAVEHVPQPSVLAHEVQVGQHLQKNNTNKNSRVSEHRLKLHHDAVDRWREMCGMWSTGLKKPQKMGGLLSIKEEASAPQAVKPG